MTKKALITGITGQDGSYLADALRACGGMVELKLTDGKLPMLFTSPDYELVVMPMLTSESQKPEDKAEAEAETITKAEKPKRKRSKAKEPVAVA